MPDTGISKRYIVVSDGLNEEETDSSESEAGICKIGHVPFEDLSVRVKFLIR